MESLLDLRIHSLVRPASVPRYLGKILQVEERSILYYHVQYLTSLLVSPRHKIEIGAARGFLAYTSTSLELLLFLSQAFFLFLVSLLFLGWKEKMEEIGKDACMRMYVPAGAPSCRAMRE